MDSISRATVEHYSNGRVALLGDAAYGNALGGFGTGMAMVGAYVLAGELALARGDLRQRPAGSQTPTDMAGPGKFPSDLIRVITSPTWRT